MLRADELSCQDRMAVWWPAKILYPATHCWEQMSWARMAVWWPAKILFPAIHCCEQTSWAVMTGWLYGDQLKYCTQPHLAWADKLSCHDWMAGWWPAKILYPAIHCCEQMSWAVLTEWLYGDQLKYISQPDIAVSRRAELSRLVCCMVTN